MRRRATMILQYLDTVMSAPVDGLKESTVIWVLDASSRIDRPAVSAASFTLGVGVVATRRVDF